MSIPAKADTRVPRLLVIAALAAAYALAGVLAEVITRLSIYGVPIWLPAGFALGTMLLYGVRAWPGVWLGAFVETSYGMIEQLGNAHSLAASFGAGAMVAAAATLQAVCAVWLARRYVDPELHLDTPDSVLRFVLFCGPLACLISPSTSVAMLYGAGRIPAAALFENWFSWWAGDTVGSILGATIVLAAIARPAALWRPRLLTVALPLAIATMITVAAVSFTASLDHQRTRLEFEKQATLLSGALLTALSVAEDASNTVTSFIRLGPNVSRATFDSFAQDVYARHPGIQAIEWVPRVPRAELEQHERATRAEGYAGYRVVEKNHAGERVPVAPRDDYFPVHYLYPLAGNQPALGFDLGSEPVRRQTIEEARGRRKMTVSPRVALIQGPLHPNGVLAFEPVFARGHDGVADLPLGYTLTVMRIDELARIALANLPQDQIAYCVEDLDSPEELAVLYLVGTPTPDKTWRAVTKFEYGGRHWELSFGPTVEYLQSHRVSYLWIVYGTAVVAALLLCAFLLILTGHTTRIETLVEQRTLELDQTRKSAERASNLLQEAVQSITLGFTIYDENDLLVICNDAYRAFHPELGVLIQPGVSFEYLVRTSVERGDHPLGGLDTDAWVQRRIQRHRSADGIPFEMGMGDGRWLLVVEQRTPSGFVVSNRVDITDLKAANAAVQDRNAQLDALFRLCPDGFVAFDPDGCVRFANPALLTMTGLTAGEVIGCSEAGLDEMLRTRTERPEAFAGVAAYFVEGDDVPPFQRLAMKTPVAATLQIVGIRSKSPNVPRLLYLRDITREAEVDRMKSEFLSHAAHELRTPMTSIFGFSELLMHSDFDAPTRRELVETIHTQTAWLVQIINELLDLARIDERRGRDFVIAETDMVALVRETLAGLAIDPVQWPLVEALPKRPVWIRADAGKSRQALTNVFANARKYSPAGGAIEVAIVERVGRLGIVVRDHGIGMTAEQVGRVGERMWRADTSGLTPGTGLGMAIVKEILTLHGGTVEVASQPGVGTSVTLWWPAAASVTA